MMKEHRAITQKDLARQLGVSQTLVSRALNGTAVEIGAAPATIARICGAAAAAGYRPSPAATSLRGGSSRTFGVVIKDFEDPFFGNFIGALQALARRHHYALLLAGGAPDDLSALWKYAPDGLMVVGSDFCPAGLDAFLEVGKPVTQIGWGVLRSGVSRVAMDQAAGLGGLVDYLAGLGHRRFGWLGSAQAPNRRREALLRTALRQRGLALAGAERLDLPPAEAGATGMTHLLARAARFAPTAVIAADDVMALGALRALHAAGRWAPEAISLAGIDDIPAARLAIPALTTLRQPVRRMIDAAFRNLLDRAAAPAPETLIAPELIVRESCGKPLIN